VRIAQGVEIAENSYIGLGSVVIDTFNEPDVLILGFPAKIVKKNIIARKSLENKNI
jgi:serine acetyltransferase